MLRINVNNIFLDLDENPVRFEVINSIFEQDAMQGDWSFPFKIKWSDKNGSAFGFANMLEVPNKKIAYRAVFYFGTKSFIVGQLLLNGGGNDYFNSNIAGGVKALLNAETSLKDLSYVNPITGDGTIVLADLTTAALDYQTTDYNNIIAFPPHSNPNFYANSNPDFQGIVNIVVAEDGTNPVNTPDFGGNKYCLVPWLYLFYVLKTGFKESGLTPSGSFWNDTEMAKILLYNNYALDKERDLGCIVKADGTQTVIMTFADPVHRVLLSDLLTGCNDDGNNFDISGSQYEAPGNLDYAFKLEIDLLGIYNGPFNTAGFSVKLIRKPLGSFSVLLTDVTFNINPGDTASGTILFTLPSGNVGDLFYIEIQSVNGADPDLYNVECKVVNATLTVTTYSSDGAYGLNTMNNVVTIKNHLPDITFEGLLNQLKKWAQLDFVYDFINNKVFINYVENVLSGPAEIDLSLKLGKNYELLFDEKNKGYIVGYNFGSSDNLIVNNFKPYDVSKLLGYYNSVDDLPVSETAGILAIVRSTNKVMRLEQVGITDWSWKEFTDNYYDVKTGNGETSVKTTLAPMMMLEAQNETNIAPDPANTRALIPAISESGSSPMFDLGENSASLRIVFMRGLNTPGGMYVLASATNYDQLGVYLGSRTMKMNDTDGLFVRLHEKIINALTNGDVVERDLLADINLLSDPRLKKKVSAGNMHWLLKSVSASIGKTIKISKSKWLKL